MTLNKKNYFYTHRSLFLVDILHIQDINSIYGYNNGNSIVQETNNLFKTIIIHQINEYLSTVNQKNTFIKIKNIYTDVFAVKIYAKLNDRVILKIKDIITNTIREHKYNIQGYGVSINIDVTVGCSQSDDKNLMTYAQKALSDAKENYASYSYFDPIFYKNELINLKIFNTIKDNINKEKVEPYFQPIVHTKTQKTRKYEALMRLKASDGTILTPNIFLNKSKKYRLYNHLMYIMIDKVFYYIKNYKIHVSINLDYYDLINAQMQRFLLERIKRDKLGDYVTIEILESEKIHEFELINEFIFKLKKYGVKIAIDDFGTGFSNYEHVLELDVDYIKLDGSIVKRIDEDIYYNLTKSIVGFCQQQNIKVVAEFIKDLKTFRYIKSLDICLAQGYYLGKPQPIQEIINHG